MCCCQGGGNGMDPGRALSFRANIFEIKARVHVVFIISVIRSYYSHGI